MGLSLLDNILLSVLSKTQGMNFEEKIDNVKFVFFYSGMTLFFSGVVLILGPSFIGTVLLYFGAKVDLSAIYEAVNNGWIQFFMNFVILGVILFILGFLLGKHLQGIIKRYAYIESTKVEEKEIYPLESDTEVSIYAETLRAEKTIVSAKEPFSIKELNSFKDRKIFIEASKEGEKKVVRGGKEVVAPLKNVLYGGKLSCGHLVGSKKDYSHLIGQTFNELTILKISEPINQKTTSRKCTCLCSCGKKTSPTLYSVLNGQVKSCGHLRGETLGKRKSLRENVDELIGKVYGKVTILTVTEPIKKKGFSPYMYLSLFLWERRRGISICRQKQK